MNSSDGAGLDSVWLDTGHVIVSTNLAIDRWYLMETAHSDQELQVSTWEHVLACLGILLTAALLIYLS